MTLAPHEFIRRFLLQDLPRGFHRIRHYGLLVSSTRKVSIARARELLTVAPQPEPVALPALGQGRLLNLRGKAAMALFREGDPIGGMAENRGTGQWHPFVTITCQWMRPG